MRKKILIAVLAVALPLLFLAWNSANSPTNTPAVAQTNTPTMAQMSTPRQGQGRTPAEAVQKPPISPLETAKLMSEAFESVSKKVTPSIVMIVNEEKLQNRAGNDNMEQFFQGQGDEGQGEDFLRRFFDFTPQQREQVEKTLGSGVVMSADGYIITNYHVVQDSKKLEVTLPDGRKVTGRIIGTDPKTDLALVKVDTTGLTPIKFGNYQDVQVGEWVLAIGTPFGEALHHTVTHGIISAKGRSNVGIADYEDFLQTDAPINPGNSGGALVDLDGNLIGINTAIISASGANAGIGFSIPINMVQSVIQQLKTNGRVIRGYLGVTIQDLTPEMQKSLHITGYQGGAVVSQVEKGTPAEKAGLRNYDVIVSLDGKPVHNNVELRDAVAALKPGSEADLGVVRDGKEIKVRMKVGELPAEQAAPGTPGANHREKLGMELQELTPDIARQLGTQQDHGIVVTRVVSGSPADEAGLQQGDVIFEVNRQPVRSVRDFEKFIGSSKDSSLLLAVDRQGRSFFVTLQP